MKTIMLLMFGLSHTHTHTLYSQHMVGVTPGVTLQTMQIEGVIQAVYFVAAGVVTLD